MTPHLSIQRSLSSSHYLNHNTSKCTSLLQVFTFASCLWMQGKVSEVLNKENNSKLATEKHISFPLMAIYRKSILNKHQLSLVLPNFSFVPSFFLSSFLSLFFTSTVLFKLSIHSLISIHSKCANLVTPIMWAAYKMYCKKDSVYTASKAQ